MSHVGNGEHDFEGLEKLEPATAKIVRQARIQARDIIDRLEPFHIDGWPDLLAKIDDCRNAAFVNARLLYPAFRRRCFIAEQELEWKEKEKRRKQIIHSFLWAVGRIFAAFILITIIGSATNLPSKTGEFFWWVVLPTILVGLSFLWFYTVTIRRIFHGRDAVPVSELKELL